MSLRPAFLGLGLLAMVLTSVIVLEIGAGGPEDDQTGIVALRHAPLVRSRPAAATETADRTAEWVETILQRPLFSRDRKPTPIVAKGDGDAAVTSVPRLTGVLISQGERRAIFAGPEGGRSLIAAVGGALGPFVIMAIEPGHVTVEGPDGAMDVALKADPEMRRTLLAQMPQPQQSQQQQQQQQPLGQPPGVQPLAPGQPPIIGQPAGLPGGIVGRGGAFGTDRPGGQQFQRALAPLVNIRPMLPNNEVDK